MKIRQGTSFLVALFWLIAVCPYLISLLSISHGHHHFAAKSENGILKFVLYHTGDGADHHHNEDGSLRELPHQHSNLPISSLPTDNHSSDDGHEVSFSSPNVLLPNFYTFSDYIPVVDLSRLFVVVLKESPLILSKVFFSPLSEKIPIHPSILRTIVLLI